jgi:glycosyltransferase involved in cell wall biosynthesis
VERPKVGVFASRFLPHSQTFIYDEVTHHQRYVAHVFARERVNPDRFSYEPLHCLASGHGWQGHAEAALYRLTTLSPRFASIIRNGRFSLLHGHFGAAGCYALPFASRFDLPLVVTFHGYDVPILLSRDRLLPRNWPYWLSSKWLLQRADLLLPVSDDLAALLAQLGAPRHRIRVHRLGTNTDVEPRVDRADGIVRVIMVGRFVEKKGFDDGIKAFAIAARDFPGARLLLIGDGPMRATYDRLIESLGIGDRVEMAPLMPHKEVIRSMRISDISLAPSTTGSSGDREGNPMVIREAGAVGLALLATRHAGIPEMIQHERTGLLVEERNVPAIADALRRLMAAPELRKQLGDAAREEMQRHFSHRDRMIALEHFYDEAIESRKQNRAPG